MAYTTNKGKRPIENVDRNELLLKIVEVLLQKRTVLTDSALMVIAIEILEKDVFASKEISLTGEPLFYIQDYLEFEVTIKEKK